MDLLWNTTAAVCGKRTARPTYFEEMSVHRGVAWDDLREEGRALPLAQLMQGRARWWESLSKAEQGLHMQPCRDGFQRCWNGSTEQERREHMRPACEASLGARQ